MPPMTDINKYFRKNEIKKILPVKFRYLSRKKLVTFVPLSHADKLTFDLAYAGAGNIGNYSVCSFRMKGIGTFIPGKNTNAFSGKKGKLSFEEEVRLEMEFGGEHTDGIIDALLESHPYEEPAYEIYDFKKRSKTADTFFLELKKKTGLVSIFRKFNAALAPEADIPGRNVSKILFTGRKIDDILQTAKEFKTEIIISIKKSKTIIKII